MEKHEKVIYECIIQGKVTRMVELVPENAKSWTESTYRIESSIRKGWSRLNTFLIDNYQDAYKKYNDLLKRRAKTAR